MVSLEEDDDQVFDNDYFNYGQSDEQGVDPTLISPSPPSLNNSPSPSSSSSSPSPSSSMTMMNDLSPSLLIETPSLTREEEELRPKLNQALIRIGALDGKFRMLQQYDAALRVLCFWKKKLPSLTLLVSPTGSGKTKVVEAIVEVTQSVAIIVVPFNVLLEDQIQRRNQEGALGSTAMMWNTHTKERLLHWSSQDNSNSNNDNNLKMIYMTPEAIHGFARDLTLFVNNLQRHEKFCCFVVDEAHHVITDAGFRPKYSELSNFFQKWPAIPILAMSATIPPTMVKPLSDALAVDRQSDAIFRASSDRPNCRYQVNSFRVERRGKELEAAAVSVIQIIQRLKRERQLCHGAVKIIVYCLSQREALTLPHKIQVFSKNELTAISVIGGLDPGKNEQHRAQLMAQKHNIQLWKEGKVDIICATSAFIEGQDQPDVRIVIFLEGAYDLISLIQGFGRSSRDGHPADCILLIKNDRQRSSQNALVTQSYAQSSKCRRQFLAQEIDGDLDQKSCRDLRSTHQICDNCQRDFTLRTPPTRIVESAFSSSIQIQIEKEKESEDEEEKEKEREKDESGEEREEERAEEREEEMISLLLTQLNQRKRISTIHCVTPRKNE